MKANMSGQTTTLMFPKLPQESTTSVESHEDSYSSSNASLSIVEKSAKNGQNPKICQENFMNNSSIDLELIRKTSLELMADEVETDRREFRVHRIEVMNTNDSIKLGKTQNGQNWQKKSQSLANICHFLNHTENSSLKTEEKHGFSMDETLPISSTKNSNLKLKIRRSQSLAKSTTKTPYKKGDLNLNGKSRIFTTILNGRATLKKSFTKTSTAEEFKAFFASESMLQGENHKFALEFYLSMKRVFQC